MRLFGLLTLTCATLCSGCEQEYRAVPRAATRAPAEPIPGTDGEMVVEPWIYGDIEGVLVTTSTHRLHMSIPEGRLRSEVPVFMQTVAAHYRTMVTSIGEEQVVLPPSPDRLDTFLFGNRDEWADWTKKRLGREAKIFLGIGRGGYTYDSESVLFDIGRYDTLCILAHEGWHQYTQSYFAHPLPAWLEEGLAAYAEGHRFRRSDKTPVFMPWRNLERFGQLRLSRSRGRLIPMDVLLNQPPQNFVQQGEQDLLTYYAQVWALVHYLVEGRDGRYAEGLSRLVQDAAMGRVATSLYDGQRNAGRRGIRRNRVVSDTFISTYFDEDVESFKKGYLDFIEEVVGSGNGMYVWRGISPITRKAP